MLEWSREHRPEFTVFRIVGEQWGRRFHELRDLLTRNSILFRFYDQDLEPGRALLEQVQALDLPRPVVVTYDGQVLANPSNADLAGFILTGSFGTAHFNKIGL